MNALPKNKFHKEILELDDLEATCEQIVNKLRQDVLQVLRRRGAVVGISGGVDSSATLALTVRALTPSRVLGLMMPERDSSTQSLELARQLADRFGVQTVVEDITEALEGFGCYRRRDEAIARVFPEYSPPTHKVKIGLEQTILNKDMPPLFSVMIVTDDETEKSKRLPLNEYLEIVAASNFKQRSRMSMLYFHAESRRYAVVGTANKHEVEQGFFVKYGDGGVDVMPIAHLYKTQVFQLARYLGVPDEIIQRVPTTDTYSAEQTQEEFFFQLPFEQLDLIWYAQEEGYAPAEVAPVLGLTEEQVKRVFKNFARKKKTTEYLRMTPISNNNCSQ